MSALQELPPAAAARGVRSPQHMVFWGIGWEAFQKILQALPSQRLRATYTRGSLEVMSPLPIHEYLKVFFGYLFSVLAEELALRMKCMGSTTFGREEVDRGIEPDNAFYFESIGRVSEWDNLDLSRDPPPDLAVEVEVTSTVLNRLEVYEALQIPEVWRCSEEYLRVLRLNSQGSYEQSDTSLALPFLPMDEVLPLFHRLKTEARDDGKALRSMRAWVRERVRPLYEAYHRSMPTE